MNAKTIGGAVAVTVLAGLLLLLKFGPDAGPGSDRGLLLHLPLSTDLLDRSRFKHPIKVIGKVQLEDAAARFLGDGGLEAPHLPLAGKPFAVSMWIRVPILMGAQGLLDQRQNDDVNRHLSIFLNGGLPSLSFLGNDARAKRRAVRENEWNHLVFVFTGDQQQIWRDGEMIGNAAAKAYEGTEGLTLIGRRPATWTHGHDFDGWMRDLRVYEGYFERTRILALRDAGPKAP